AAFAGSTDSEVLFRLALTFGLERDPLGALEATIGFAEAALREHGIDPNLQASMGVSDGETLWAVRYASAEEPRTLFTSADAQAMERLYPETPRLARLQPGDRLVVSEPFADLPGMWNEIPAGSAVIVGPGGRHEQLPFTPRTP